MASRKNGDGGEYEGHETEVRTVGPVYDYVVERDGGLIDEKGRTLILDAIDVEVNVERPVGNGGSVPTRYDFEFVADHDVGTVTLAHIETKHDSSATTVSSLAPALARAERAAAEFLRHADVEAEDLAFRSTRDVFAEAAEKTKDVDLFDVVAKGGR